MIIAGYVFSAINYVLYCVGRFTKKKSAIVLFCLFALFMAGISNYCFGSLTGSLALFVQIPVVFLAYIKEKKPFNKWVQLGIYIVSFILVTLILAYTYEGVSSILAYLGTSLAIYSYWWMNEQQMRVTGVFIGVLFFAYCMSIHNYLGILELFVIGTNIISYLIYRKKVFREVDYDTTNRT